GWRTSRPNRRRASSSSRWICTDRSETPSTTRAASSTAPIVHDPFHIMRLAGAMLDELRREVFCRAGPELRAVGRGRRWLLLRAWERVADEDRVALRRLLACNRTLARA